MNDDEFKRKIIEHVTTNEDDSGAGSTSGRDVQVIEVVNVEDDTGPFPKIEHEEMKIDQTPQITEELEYYENFEQSPEEIAETELMIREDRKEELKKLAYNQGLRHETYYLINKQFKREIAQHPPKNVDEKIFENKPEDYPETFMINKLVDWEASKINLATRPYKQPLYHAGALEDDFGIRYHFNQIQSLDTPYFVTVQVVKYTNDLEEEPEKIYVQTDVYGAFLYVLNKEKNIPSTRAVKIQTNLTIQIKKHSKTHIKNYIKNKNIPNNYITHLDIIYVFLIKEEEIQKYMDYVNKYISQILKHIYGESSAKFI
jgi:hypothetical protein